MDWIETSYLVRGWILDTEGKKKVKEQLEHFAANFDLKRVRPLSLGIGLGKIGKPNVQRGVHTPLSEQNNKKADASIANNPYESTNQIPQTDGSKSLAAIETTQSEISERKSGFISRMLFGFLRLFTIHISDILVVFAVLFFILAGIQGVIFEEFPRSVSGAPAWFMRMFQEWQQVIVSLNALLILYACYLVYLIVFKIAAGQTIGQFFFKIKKRKS